MIKEFKNKWRLLGALFMALVALNANALEFAAGSKKNSYIDVEVNNIEVQGDQLLTDLSFDLSKVNLKGNSELVVTPVFMDNNGNEVELEGFTVAGRNRYYWLERNNKEPEILYKGWGKAAKTDRLQSLQMESIIPYEPWMNDATLALKTQDLGCANCYKGENDFPLAQTEYIQLYYFPEYLYVTPVAEAVKMREISARAYIDFVVNRTEINPTYRRNPVELAKIRATIDSVRNDKDITVKKLHISGTASPEGSYQNNVRLAKGRTQSLSDYVQNLYRFPKGVLTTSYEPVDWEGLSQFLRLVLGISDHALGNDSIRQDQFKAIEQFLGVNANVGQGGSVYYYASELPHAREILNIVNGDLEPYARNSKIRSTYPKEYAWLLANVYPALRHSDYRIEFEIKTYTEVSEIIDVMQTAPNKLSLAELFVAANSQPQGSELYNRAFELAVTMYPEDETANLNAGIAAMQRGDLITANRYLNKAGNTDEAEYARGILMVLEGNQDKAEEIFYNLSLSSNQSVADKATEAKEGYDRLKRENGFHYHVLE